MELPGDAFSAPSCHPFYALLGAGHRYEGSKDATNEAPGQYYELPVGLEPKMDRFFRCLRVKKDPEPTSVRVRFGFAVSNGFVSHSWRTSSSRVPRVPRRFHGDSLDAVRVALLQVQTKSLRCQVPGPTRRCESSEDQANSWCHFPCMMSSGALFLAFDLPNSRALTLLKSQGFGPSNT